MRAVLAAALAASLVAGCGIRRPPPVVEVVEIACPSVEPPAIYALPQRREDFVTPDDYEAERAVLEGRHGGFSAELDSWRETWAQCPGRGPGDGRP